MNELAIECPCGHKANFHASDEQQTTYLRATGGRYAKECTGAPMANWGPHCRCTTSQEKVIKAGST